jgi:hypothetical protein
MRALKLRRRPRTSGLSVCGFVQRLFLLRDGPHALLPLYESNYILKQPVDVCCCRHSFYVIRVARRYRNIEKRIGTPSWWNSAT